jgi:hypothetical protein
MPCTLTDELIAELEPADRDVFVFDGDQPGFAVRCTPNGTKIFLPRLVSTAASAE